MTTNLTPSATLSALASEFPAASRIFQTHRLDFCCGGGRPLEDACAERDLDPKAILLEIEATLVELPPNESWSRRPLPELVDHIVRTFHEPLRPELERLRRMAARVEKVHGDKPEHPQGLADHLGAVKAEVESHLAKEEGILFPMILAGHGRAALGPVAMMTREHDQHGENLRKIRKLTGDLVPPAHACTTWRALYLGLEQLEADLMEHIHLENNILFPRALGGSY